MSSDLVSVVVPSFNRAHRVVRTVDSALGQTHPEVEVIIVDDGSADDTRAVVEKAYGGNPRVRYIYQPNGGVSSARNHGMREARGEYVALLDSDDVWKPWKLEVQVACMRFAPQVGMVWTDMEAIDADGRVTDSRFLRRFYSAYRHFTDETLFPASHPLADVLAAAGPSGVASGAPELAGARLHVGDIYSQMIMGNLVHTSTVLLRRDRMEKVKGFDETLRPAGEDYDFHLRVCREGPVGLADAPAILYQRGQTDSITHKYARAFAVNFLKTITNALDRDRDRIRLPKHLIRDVLAEANAWVGEQLLEAQENSGARKHLARSLMYRTYQPRTLALLTAASMPPPMARGLRRAYRGLKGTKSRA